MVQEAVINEIVIKLKKLAKNQDAIEISLLIDKILQKQEDALLTKGIQILVSQSKAFDFLNEDEEIYSLTDLKEIYRAKR